MGREIRIFYQCASSKDYVFTGKLPGVKFPNMTFSVILNHYDQIPHGYFYLFLKNGFQLSVLNVSVYTYELMEVNIETGRVSFNPRFLNHDGCGIETVLVENLHKRILELSERVL